MKTDLPTEIKEVLQATHYRPSVSIILPIESQLRVPRNLGTILKTTADKVEVELARDYPDETCQLMMKKIRAIMRKIKVPAHKKSVAIYVSPIFEKVLFMSIPAQQRIVIDESFEIRDLIYDKKQETQYLLLMLSRKQARIYLGNTTGFTRIRSSVAESMEAYVNQWPEQVANFTDSNERKLIITIKFLQHIDKGLTSIMNEYKLPVFVLGTERILGHFKKLTKHRTAVADFIPGGYSRLNFSQLKETMEPHLNSWQHRQQSLILEQLELAASKDKLTTGIKSVWKGAMDNAGHSLVVENNFVCAAARGAQLDIIEISDEPFNNISYYKDAVDDIIEKVMANGGNVDFAEPDALKAYDHIALVNY